MKSSPAGYILYEIPELEETEFALMISPCPRIEDASDAARLDDSISFAVDTRDELADV